MHFDDHMIELSKVQAESQAKVTKVREIGGCLPQPKSTSNLSKQAENLIE